MISFALPWVAGAGLLLGLVPLALHFLVRRPPARADLPTARFLTPDPRTRVAMDRRPRDLLLLILRVAFVLLLGMGLAGPRLVGERSGTATWVLLDADPTMGPVWREALSAARDALADVEGPALLLRMGTEVTEIPVRPFLEGGDVAAPAGGAPEGYLGHFRALRRRLEVERGVDSVAVVLVTRPRRESWHPGFGGVRTLLYPGAVRLVEVEADVAAGGVEEAPGRANPRRALVARTGEDGRFIEAAMEALGRPVGGISPEEGEGEGVGSGGPGLVIVPGTAGGEGLLEAMARGDTVVVEAGHPVLSEAPPLWDAGVGSPPGAGSAVLLTGDVRVVGAVLHGGGPAAGVRIPVTGEDGRPAAAARAVGGGCLVVAGFRLEGGALPQQPAYPRLLEALAAACRSPDSGTGPLDRGALELLRSAEFPPRVALGSLTPEAGIDLSRWFLLAALLLAILEGFLGYRKP